MENVNNVLVNKSKTLNELQELVNKVLQLQAHNTQLRNVIAKQSYRKIKKENNKRKLDFSERRKIHVLLKLMYLGWDYQGFACQEDSTKTIEHNVMQALLITQLIESRETSNYHRCGRTDKGVSSSDQVISITLRASHEGQPELDYCGMLNRLLPSDIRAVAWCQVGEEVSARFNCTQRIYRYYFPLSNLSIEDMNEAATYLVGSNDFRNLCKMDVGNGVVTFIRRIQSAKIIDISEANCKEGNKIGMLELVGNAFLWHQVRCIVSVLLLVGKKLEKPDVIKELLDVSRNNRKPQYPMADPIGLNLYECHFDMKKWNVDTENVLSVIADFQRLWTEHKIRTIHIEEMVKKLESMIPDSKQVYEHVSALIRKESKTYKPLLSRQKCKSLEDRITHYRKKGRLETKI